MSARKRRLVVVEAARQDIQSILLFTRQQWGIRQRDRYRGMLDNALALILSNPLIGPSRDDLGPAMRTRVVERHIIYYRVEDEFIRVLRVMHQRIDPTRRQFEDLEVE